MGAGGRIAADKPSEKDKTIVKIDAENSDTISAYPNPFVDRVTVKLGKDVGITFNASLVNAAGTVVFQQSFEREPSQQEVELLLNEDLSSGIYVFRVLENSGKSQTIRLMKR